MKRLKQLGVVAAFGIIGFGLFHCATEPTTGSAAWTTEAATNQFTAILEAQRDAIEAHTPLDDVTQTKLSPEDDAVRLVLGQRDRVARFHYDSTNVQVSETAGSLYASAYVMRDLRFQNGITSGLGDERTIRLTSPDDPIDDVELDNHSVTKSDRPFFERWLHRLF